MSALQLPSYLLYQNVRAFLDTLAWSEGTVTSPVTKDYGYDVIVDALTMSPVPPHRRLVVHATFADYSSHPFDHRPAVLVSDRGTPDPADDLYSTAAGRYMCLHRYWVAYKGLLALPDFGHRSQDLIALQMVRECRALDDLVGGNLDIAVGKCASRWASLPGAGYKQRENALVSLEAAYQKAGGNFA